MSKIQQTNRNIGRLLLLLIALLRITTVISVGEQLPVKTYTTGDGLPRDAVTLIKQDSRGFIWLVAGDGLSRFDGYKITNYTTDVRKTELLQELFTPYPAEEMTSYPVSALVNKPTIDNAQLINSL